MSLAQRPVSEVMEREIVSVRIDDHLDLADDIMRLGRVRHMPVLDGERLVGIVTNRDLLAASLTKALNFEPEHRRAFMRAVEVREVMTSEVVSVGPDTPLEEAVRIMLRRKIGCLPVVKGEGRLVGLVTESALLRAAYLGDEGEDVVVVGSEVESESSSSWRDRFEQEVAELRRARDELRVRIHLGKADARDLWDRLEQRFSELEGHARRAAQRSSGPLQELGDAARHLVEELRAGYRDLRGRF